MIEKLLSVVVPIYNVEDYIEKCLNSILEQSYKNLEIIVINDGSTDGSLEICKDFVKRDERIQLVSQENKGVMAARTLGAELASGQYIAFVDGDDYIEPHMYETMMQYVEDVDLVTCGVKRQWSDDRTSIVCDEMEDGVKVENIWEKMIYDFERAKLQPFTPWIWNKIYIRDCALEVLQLIDSEIVYAEDSVFLYQYLLRCKSVKILKDVFYNYRYRDTSVWHSRNNKMLQNINQVYLALHPVFEKHYMRKSLNTQLEKWVIFMTMRAINHYMGFSEKNRIPQFVINVEEVAHKEVIVYGAGQMGQDVVLQLERNGVKIVSWIDRDYAYYQSLNMNVQSLECLKQLKYDIIVIAVSSEKLADMIRQDLCGVGIEEQKIVWLKPEQLF